MTTPATAQRRGQRRDEILQVLADMLQSNGSDRITTASLAAKVGVSEAALYRHFASKAKMYDGLLDFVETSIFTRVNTIVEREDSALDQLPRIVNLVLAFAEANPGISRVLSGHALMGEDARLQQRSAQIFARLETLMKQIVRTAEHSEGLRTPHGQTASVNLLMAYIDGKIAQYVRSGFKQNPTEQWEDQWTALSKSLFRISVHSAQP